MQVVEDNARDAPITKTGSQTLARPRSQTHRSTADSYSTRMINILCSHSHTSVASHFVTASELLYFHQVPVEMVLAEHACLDSGIQDVCGVNFKDTRAVLVLVFVGRGAHKFQGPRSHPARSVLPRAALSHGSQKPTVTFAQPLLPSLSPASRLRLYHSMGALAAQWQDLE
ncbi:hypothetical protein BD779DRAFT_1774743 [Infundibulicybe gibba]|nr:hypothetical protein BD779DRAFT_1774743 [Infundibulicybe gibba]